MLTEGRLSVCTSELSPVLWLSCLELPVLTSFARGGFQVLSCVERL